MKTITIEAQAPAVVLEQWRLSVPDDFDGDGLTQDNWSFIIDQAIDEGRVEEVHNLEVFNEGDREWQLATWEEA
jgi:hypothetical protein